MRLIKSTASISALAVAFAVAPSAYCEVRASEPVVSDAVNVAQAPVANDLPQEQGVAIADIIVTAERRSTSLQDTPIAITALTSEQIEKRGVQSLARLAQATPNVQFSTIIDNAIVTIRGIGARTNNAGGDPSVAFHVDGVYLARLGAANASFYDLERIEVLRGPQGTLYGRNATGGAINLISHQVELNKWEGSADLLYGNYDRLAVRGVLNVPVGDDAGLRVSGIYDARDGYVKSVTPGLRDRNDDRNAQIKGQLRIRPASNVDLVLRSSYTTKWGSGPAQQNLTQRAFAPAPGFSFSLTAPRPFGYGISSFTTGFYRTAENIKADLRTKVFLASGQLTVDDINLGGLGSAQWQTIAAYQYFDQSFVNDTDGLPVAISDNDAFIQSAKQYSIETRLASSGDGPASWLAGLYYFNENAEDDITAHIYLPMGLVITAKPGATGNSKSYAAFGQLSYDFSPQWRLTGGLRYTHDKKSSVSRLQPAPPLPPGSPLPPAAFVSREANWSAVTGKANLDFRPTDNNLLYAQVSRGYKAGGFALNQAAYDPENVWAYEVGSKNQFFNRKLTVNLSAFYYDYTDLQVAVLPAGSLTQIIQNAAAAKIKGVELEGIVVPAQGLRLNASINYLDAAFDRYSTVDESDPAGGIHNLDGRRIPNSPKWSGAVGVEYTLDLGSAGQFVPRVDLQWTSGYLFRPHAIVPYDVQRGFAKVDMSARWTASDEKYFAEVFGTNLTGKKTYNYLFFSNLGGQFQGVTAPPAMYGIRVGVKF